MVVNRIACLMTSATVPPIWQRSCCSSVLGLAVFHANPKRKSTSASCFSPGHAWRGSVVSICAFTATDPAVAEFAIRQASVAGALCLAMLNLLRLSILQTGAELVRYSASLLDLVDLAPSGSSPFARRRIFLQEARISTQSGAAGHAHARSTATGVMSIRGSFCRCDHRARSSATWRDLRETTGGEHAELAFILIGGTFGADAYAALLRSLLDAFHRATRLIWFAPFASFFSAWSSPMASPRRKIMEVGFSFGARSSIALLDRLSSRPLRVGLVAGFCGLRSAAPARGEIARPRRGRGRGGFRHGSGPRHFPDPCRSSLSSGPRRLDFRSTMNEAAAILKSVTTLAGPAGTFCQDHRWGRRHRSRFHPASRTTARFLSTVPASDSPGGAPSDLA